MARRLRDICEVDIYPNDSVLQSAWNRGEINQDFLEMRLQHWLDLQSLELPPEVIERFCRATLLLNKLSSSKLLAAPELKSLTKKLSRFKSLFAKKHSIKHIVSAWSSWAVRGLLKISISISSSGVNCSWMNPRLSGPCQIAKKVSIMRG